MLSLIFVLGATSSCAAQKNKELSALPPDIRAQAESALSSVHIGDADRSRIVEAIGNDPSGFALLFREVRDVMKKDPDLLRRVDKSVALPANFVPADLVVLDGAFRMWSPKGMLLRAPARDALVRMAEAAKKEGRTLVVSSTYRSYDYQKTVFERNVREMGKAEAERVSAQPGMSQHQLGTAVDFGSITDEFGDTAAGRWLSANAGKVRFFALFPERYGGRHRLPLGELALSLYFASGRRDAGALLPRHSAVSDRIPRGPAPLVEHNVSEDVRYRILFIGLRRHKARDRPHFFLGVRGGAAPAGSPNHIEVIPRIADRQNRFHADPQTFGQTLERRALIGALRQDLRK